MWIVKFVGFWWSFTCIHFINMSINIVLVFWKSHIIAQIKIFVTHVVFYMNLTTFKCFSSKLLQNPTHFPKLLKENKCHLNLIFKSRNTIVYVNHLVASLEKCNVKSPYGWTSHIHELFISSNLVILTSVDCVVGLNVNMFFIFHIFRIENLKFDNVNTSKPQLIFLSKPNFFAICLNFQQQNPLKK